MILRLGPGVNREKGGRYCMSENEIGCLKIKTLVLKPLYLWIFTVLCGGFGRGEFSSPVKPCSAEVL